MRPVPRLIAIAALICALAGCGSSSSSSGSSGSSGSSSTSSSGSSGNTGAPTGVANPNAPGPEIIPLERGALLAPANSTAPGTKIDGVIQCAPLEQLAYHIHAHLQVFVNGSPRSIPGAIGMLDPVAQQTAYGPFWGAQKCYYWLHTHASDGIIHIESPTARIYTLGMFFDEWRQPLGPSIVSSAEGPVTAIVNGKPFKGNPRNIKLEPHATIQLAVGKPVPPFEPVDWAATKL